MIIRRFSEDCQFTSLQVQKTTKTTLQKWPKICGNVFLVKCSDIRPRGKEERLLSIVALFLAGICFLAYFGVSGVLTLMYPYNIPPEGGALPKVFALKGGSWAKYVVSLGAL